MAVAYVCEWSGFAGHVRDEEDADIVHRSQYGNHVMPLPNPIGIVT
jgi:hypothetical protein